MTKRNTKRMAKRVTAAALSVILASSGMVIAPEADAAAKPTLASVAKVAVQKISKLTVKANGFQIKKVTAKSANVKIATVKVTGGDISITGKKAGKTFISTTVNAVKDSKKQVFNYKTKVTVQDDGSVVVNTQKELNAALKKKNIKKLTIGKKAKSLTIPKGKYKKTELTVNAPKASIVNKGSFKSIEIQAIAPNTWTEDAANDETRITTATKFHFVASENARIKDLIVSGGAQSEGNIEIDGSVTTMVMKSKMVVKVSTGGTANLGNVNVNSASSFTLHVSGNSVVGVLSISAKGANIGVTAGADSSIGTIDVKAEASSGADAAEGEKTKVEVKAEGNAKVDNIKTAAENTTVDITADGSSTVSNVKIEGKGEASVSGTSENTTTIDVKDAASDAKVVVNTPTVKVETKEGTDTDKIVNNQSGQSIQIETTKADGTVETGTKPSTVPATTPTTPSTTPTTPTTPAQTDPAAGGGGGSTGGGGGSGGGGSGGGSGSKVSSLKLDKTSIEVGFSQGVTGPAAEVSAIVSPVGTKVTWKIADGSIATILSIDGNTVRVAGLREGSTTLTATAGSFSASCSVSSRSNYWSHYSVLSAVHFVALDRIEMVFDPFYGFDGGVSITKKKDKSTVFLTRSWQANDNTVVCTVRDPFENGETYEVNYFGTVVEFTAKYGEPASVILRYNTFPQYQRTGVDFSVIDGAGVDITAALPQLIGDYEYSIDIKDGIEGKDWFTPGDGRCFVYMDTVGEEKTVEVTVSYDNGSKVIKNTSKIKCVSNPRNMFVFNGNGHKIDGWCDLSSYADENGYLEATWLPMYDWHDRGPAEYVLTGWSLDEDGSNMVDNIYDYKIDKHTIFYAQWKQLHWDQDTCCYSDPVLSNNTRVFREDKKIIIDDVRGGIDTDENPQFTAVAVSGSDDVDMIRKINSRHIDILNNDTTTWTEATGDRGNRTATLDSDFKGNPISNSKYYVIFGKIKVGNEWIYTDDQLIIDKYLTISPEITWNSDKTVSQNINTWSEDYKNHPEEYLNIPDNAKVVCDGVEIKDYDMHTQYWVGGTRDGGIEVSVCDIMTHCPPLSGTRIACQIIVKVPTGNIEGN